MLHIRLSHQCIGLLIRNKQGYIAADCVRTGTYHTITNDHNHLRRHTCRLGIRIRQVVVDKVRTLNPERSLTVVGHELRTDGCVARKVRLATITESEIVLRRTTIGCGVPSAEFVSVRRKGCQHHFSLRRKRRIRRRYLRAAMRDGKRTIGRRNERQLDLLDETGIVIRIGMRITRTGRTCRHRLTDMRRPQNTIRTFHQITIIVIPTREDISGIGHCPIMEGRITCYLHVEGRRSRTGHRLVRTGCRLCGIRCHIHLTGVVRRTRTQIRTTIGISRSGVRVRNT